MSLLQTLPYTEYTKALNFPLEKCEVIAKLANLKISFDTGKPPGHQLMKILDRRGFSAEKYNELLASASKIKTIKTYYKPYAKVAILIANDKYKNLPKLATPSIDCDSLAANLNGMGFIVVLLKNIPSEDLRNILTNIFSMIPKKSYCFTYYAGHGCEISSCIRCMLSVDCPEENIEFAHCITENFILTAAAKSKVELCIFIMDMCRLILDRSIHPQMYAALPTIDDFKLPKNFLVAYSTQQSQAAYEVLQIECSTTIEDDTYQLETGDTDKIVPGASLYVNSLCTWLSENLDVSSLLDKVHEEVEGSPKDQRPIKVQRGTSKKSLYDPVTGDIPTLLNSLKDAVKDYQDKHSVSVF